MVSKYGISLLSSISPSITVSSTYLMMWLLFSGDRMSLVHAIKRKAAGTELKVLDPYIL